jgi:citrate lyase subunit beta/citryl-CoA lyase
VADIEGESMTVTDETQETMPRSLLYVPADRPELFAKARAGIADALLFDLEDSVPAERKGGAREHLRRFLSEDRGSRPEQELWVRITAESSAEDLAAVVVPGVVGVMQAKASEAVLRSTAAMLGRLEPERSVPQALGIIALIEDANALEHLGALAAVDRVVTFAVGEVDLLADLRMTPSPATEAAIAAIRSRIVIGAVAGGLRAPIAPTSTAVKELDLFEATSAALRDLGFRSRTAIHPSQLALIHAAFTPSVQEVESAMDITERFAAASGGVALDERGRMIDAAVVRRAKETLSRDADARSRSEKRTG